MQNTANTSRFLIDISFEREFADSGIPASFCSKLLEQAVVSQMAHAAKSRQSFNQLGHQLIQIAGHFASLRDMGALEEVSRVLLNLPIAYARQVGQYYQALAISRNGQKYEALSLLEIVADDAPFPYRARAIQSLGAVYHELGLVSEALRLYTEAARAASLEGSRDLLTTLIVSQEIALIKSEMGDHRGALADYENLSPLVQIVGRQNPLYFYFYHNELAIELAEAGRLAEAEAALSVALASPFAHAYPEWHETRDEIAAKRASAAPSVVAVKQIPLPAPSPQVARKCKAKPSINLAFSCSVSNKDFFQRSTLKFPATTSISLNAVSILDRMQICIGPRAPPALS
jgi:tetratricopeptide (TPR) repeat protein